MKQIFESERISFEEVTPLLINDYLMMINDMENVNRYISNRREYITTEQEEKWIKEKIVEKALIYSMIEKSTGEFIGNTEFMDNTSNIKELGIALTAAKQNQGFGTEAVKRMIQYGFQTLGLEKIVLRTNVENARAIHVYQKCGFKIYGKTEEHYLMEIIK